MSGSKEKINVVLVHGAWADGSSWNDTGAARDTETVYLNVERDRK